MKQDTDRDQIKLSTIASNQAHAAVDERAIKVRI